ncbi:MAG: ABC transporter permease [Chryseolinea sp.]
MLQNYFKIAWRNLINSPGSSLINIGGLAIGMAVALLIGVWVFDELNFNKSFENYDRLGQVYHHITFGEDSFAMTEFPAPMGDVLKTDFPEFEEIALATFQQEHIIDFNEKKLSKAGLFVEPQFTAMFSVKMLKGSEKPLADVHSIILSKTLATTLLGNEPVGKMIKFDNRDLLMVTGVFEEFPSNSEFNDIHMLMPLTYFFSVNEAHRLKINNWEDFSFQCFVLMDEEASFNKVQPKLKQVLYDRTSVDGKAMKPQGFLFPMKGWHLYSDFKNGVSTQSRIRSVWMFTTLGFFVLLIACINFMNLSTARSEKRSREVGVRKVMGSQRKQLVIQFLSESMLIAFLSFCFALGVVAVTFPWFNDLAGKQMLMPWTDLRFLLISLAFVFITGGLAGSYPALYLSSFSPVKVLKGTFKTGRFALLPRKIMVTFQFITSIVLIVGTVVVYLQIKHAKQRPVGFDRQGILQVNVRTDALAKADYNALRNELLATNAVENMAISDFPVTGAMAGDGSLSWEGKDPAATPLIALNSCSHDFPKTNGFQFVEGRDFSREYSIDTSAVIINELAAKLISEKDIIGKKIMFGQKERVIVGVIKDQIRWTPYMKQSPHLYYINYAANRYLTIRLNQKLSMQEALHKIEAVIKKFDDAAPFDYKFQDDEYARLFEDEERLGTLAAVFSALAIFISCIGIFGLATFAAGQRVKEIGIRKVLGASVYSLWRMLSYDFVKLVLIAILLGLPLSYYLATRWLQQYEYRTKIPWMVFLVTALLAVAITLLTVSYQAIKAAVMDPVKSLRTD